MKKETPAAKPARLEDNLERLEAIVAELESGEADLERAIELYREGRELGASCQERLAALEKQVQVIRQTADGSVKAEPFEADE